MAETAVYTPVLGVDITPDFIRLVEIERVGQEYFLRHVGIAKTPAESVEQGFIRNPAAVGRALREMLNDGRISTRNAVTAVRGPGVVSRLISMPSMPHERMRSLIETEVKRYIRFSEEDKVVYYHPMEEFEEGGRRKLSILLVVARKDLCNSYYDAFRQAGLELTSIDVSFYSVLRVLRNNMTAFPPGSLMSVVFDYDGVAVNILHADTVRFFRNIRLDSLDVNQFGNGFMDRVLSELMLSVHYYEEEFPRREDIRKMVLSMNVCGNTDAPMRVAEAFGAIPVEMHAPFTNIRVDPKDFSPKTMEQVDMSFLTAVGLSLRGREIQPLTFEVDLLPAEIGDMKTLNRALKIFALFFLLTALGFAAHVGWMKYQAKQLDAQLAAIKTQSDTLDRVIAADSAKRVSQMSGNVESAAVPRTKAWATLLGEVKKVVPKNVQILGLVIDEAAGSVEFTGAADDNAGIFYFMSSLGRSAVFTSPQLGPRSNMNLNGTPMVRFVIRCGYKL